MPSPPSSVSFATPADVDAYLDSRGFFRMELTQDRIAQCLQALGLDSAPCPVIQVVGTNGKGSTACFLANIAAAHGLRAGLFTSPHFVHPRERMVTVDDFGLEPIHEEDWLEAANAVFQTPTGPELTYFELTMAMAMTWFREVEVDVMILEAGLGGAGDATTAAPRDLVIMTPIGMDHTDVLGDSLAAIASDKAKAVPHQGMVLTPPQDPRAMHCLERVASAREASLMEVRQPRGFDPDFGFYPLPDPLAGEGPAPIPLGIMGPHQSRNARLAMAAWLVLAERFHWPTDIFGTREGLLRAFIPGRLQDVPAVAGKHPALLLDSAHNLPALDILESAVARLPTRPRHLVFTCLREKDLTSMAPVLARLCPGECIIPELAHSVRALPAADVAAVLRPVLGERVRPAGHIAEALAPLQEPALVCGSLYLLGEFFTVHPHLLGPWQPTV